MLRSWVNGAVQVVARRLPPRLRRVAGRLVRLLPVSAELKRFLWEASRPQPPSGVLSAVSLQQALAVNGHPVSPEEPDYLAWAAFHALTEDALREGQQRLASFVRRPLVSVLMPVHDPELTVLQAAVASLQAQLYPHWELCVVDDASTDPAIPAWLLELASGRPDRVRYRRLASSEHVAGATNAALALARGEYVAFLDHDDELTPDALLHVVAALQADPPADIVYSDHDVLDASGLRRQPSFKPDWCPELLLSYMYFGHLKLYRTSLVLSVGGFRAGFEGSADYDLALRLVERTDRIVHVPRILYHWRAAPRSMARDSRNKPQSFESGRKAVQEALERRGIAADAEQPEFAARNGLGLYRLRFRDTTEVPVTVVIPTRDRLDLLRPCLESIEKATSHRRYQVLIIDNESREGATLRYLADCPHRVVRFENGGAFNFAAIANRGVEAAETEFVVLLNNDTLVINPEWLDELIGYGRLPGVGAVGAKLLYADGRIQHAGVILGTHGLTGHAFQPRKDVADQLEYQGYAHVARNYLAVSAACMLTRKSVFREVGGFNDRELKVAWNDVDYCLRLRERGYRVVFDPYAALHHLESQSRGDDKNPDEIRYMLGRWRHYVDRDPFYSPNLSCRDAEFRIKSDPAEDQHFYYREYR